jgi:hypothetical protein
VHHWLVLQFLHPVFKVPEMERSFRKKFVHKNHNKFVRVLVPNNDYLPREELPLHRLEWRGCRMDNRDHQKNGENLLTNNE